MKPRTVVRWMATLKRTVIRILERMQGTHLYRFFSHRGGMNIRIKAASDVEWAAVDANLIPGHSDSFPGGNRGVSNFIALKRDHIVGHVQLVRKPGDASSVPEYWLFNLAVRIRHRRKGIGEALTRQVIASSQREEATDLRLLVFENNLPAVQLYQSLGFELKNDPGLEPRLARDKEVFGSRRILMIKSLPPTSSDLSRRDLSGGEDNR